MTNTRSMVTETRKDLVQNIHRAPLYWLCSRILLTAVCAVMLLVLQIHAARASDLVILPVFGNQPDTGVQLGVAGIWEQEPVADSYAANIFLIGTEKRQAQGVLGLRIPGVVEGRRDYFEAEIYGSYFPSEFFGYRSTFLNKGTDYDERTLQLKLGWSYPLDDTWRVGIGGLTAGSRIEFDDPDDPLLDDVAWTEGGRLLGIEGSLTRDTRNNLSWPTMGTWLKSSATLAHDDGGETFGWASQSGAVYYQAPADVILALGGQVQAATDNTPFLYMPILSGGQWMRGLRDGQYRHQTTVATQLEGRFPLTQRWAATTFVHTGQVAERPDQWWDEDWKRGGGFGLRYSVSDERRLNIRVDYGWVDSRGGLVINFGEAF
ncbi:MAG: BamA/TamA family outer membrane protein [Natronospirillum sp.]|uniref:BamA/TamA family outer membrane protein n=1 Tax=Natronospirillum sp. TaxID=2812955 RepID=UPI0025DA8E48|nr:BamA/TamA family outer membrane protein [Natronospirillum sp.]MCH8551509.1 BamA/TamA family outer membrane protein [Natronospirillum sp.]